MSAKLQALGLGPGGLEGEVGRGWGGCRGKWSSLAPITLLGGRRLGDDAHAGGAATHVTATGGTEASAATTIGEAAAVAAPAPAVACASRGGDHSCREKAQGTLAVFASFLRPTLPGPGAHGTSSGKRISSVPQEQGQRVDMCSPSPSHAAQHEHLYWTSHLSKAFTAETTLSQ